MRDQVQHALAALAQMLDAPVTNGTALGNWRWTVRQRLAAVRDGLSLESAQAADGWLVAREGSVLRERTVLMTRLSALGPAVLEAADVSAVREELRRVVADISHHRQRLHDLAYDEVELELGGSE
ncbi:MULTISPECIES: hypothetical protein [unclassified Nocardioides]|uniref:hypothetical protein n=1 Tax=unclassified Nocardioides TaxID=2615069 RepID=UPI0006F9B747|nr:MULTISPECIES: hypothetical protein [unclassified Nocardioides]KQY57543.1 hypothetical protein ASD30_15280 [Nocardioides sp. Root140]KQZ76088.1 hypothetical protein ASD66_07365 [Nocardioides sp. Root151]KRF20258.1 hypothetical protein ASH02_21260 [Nocardioides sp. Soil796]